MHRIVCGFICLLLVAANEKQWVMKGIGKFTQFRQTIGHKSEFNFVSRRV